MYILCSKDKSKDGQEHNYKQKNYKTTNVFKQYHTKIQSYTQ
jgi:hypothetical protein